MKILSLFDGMSCGRIAFERAGIKVDKYYASEIDKYAIKVSEANYPDIIRLGDITKWKGWDIENPDIIIGGSPCQGFSFAGKQLNFEDPRSKLFFEFVDIVNHYKPKYFLLENVIMKKEYNDVISGILGEIYPECVQQTEIFRTGRLEPIEINSALVSAQNRRRLYWTNIPGITQPEDKGILLKDIIENGETEKEKSYCIDANYFKGSSPENYIDKSRRRMIMKDIGNRIIGVQNDDKHSTASEHVYHKENDKGSLISAHIPKIITGGAFRGRNPENPSDRTAGAITEQRLEVNKTGKSNTLTSVQKDNVLVIENIQWRKLTPIECERLQTVPDNYTNHVSNSQRYKMLGNGWTVDVIAHILEGLK